ncbi:MAG: tRNA (adenosine(37)-N6)-threonylcarbamoyltransferase complex dimerization subunit type 1 TsaB [Erysipelothrix sp.]|nr:tRNA (adenosine(37)-N6)-threonylcarbamoyltransferase complex dimerization subunit type 1 TsaB [Erysipelothrix sp.]
MKQLFIDTAHRHLTVACVENESIISMIHQDAFKSQSEKVMDAIDECFRNADWQPTQLQAIVLTEGPGSYTGVRIAMTVAKVLASVASIKVYTTTTLQLIAGSSKNTFVLLDARSSRVYGGLVDDGQLVYPASIFTIDQINQLKADHFEWQFAGDLHLMGEEDQWLNIEDGILTSIKNAVIVDDIDSLVPLYLKSSQEYQL